MLQDVDLNSPILKNATIMYLEDEATLLNEISQIFSGFFKEVIAAPDGKAGLELYNQRKDDIDLIITDINMPHMNGIEFMSEVRKEDKNIPILICTAFNETENIIKAIKLKVDDYILKPVQMTTTLKIIYNVLEDKHSTLMFRKQAKELEQYKSILDRENLVIETSLDGEIQYVNDLYCEISGYTQEELIGHKNSVIKHPDTQDNIAKGLWETISSGEVWHGKLKNLSKSEETFHIKTTVMPIFDKDGNIEKYMSVGFLITDEEVEKQTLKKFIMQQKSEKVKMEHEYQVKLDSALKEALENAHKGDVNKQNKLIELVNELDNELRNTREKYNEEKARLQSLENKLKNANHKLENMQGGYQDRIDELHSKAKSSGERFDDIKQKNMILENKLEKAQESIQTMQEYIDGYRKQIDDLTSLIHQYEEKIKATPHHFS